MDFVDHRPRTDHDRRRAVSEVISTAVQVRGESVALRARLWDNLGQAAQQAGQRLIEAAATSKDSSRAMARGRALQERAGEHRAAAALLRRSLPQDR